MIKDFKGISPDVEIDCFIAETADIIGDVHIGNDSNVWYNAVIRGDVNTVRIGKNTNVQDGCMLHVSSNYPLNIGKDVTIGHKAIVHGCKIEDNVLIGMGSIILDGAHIGENTIIGAGSLVPPGKEIPSGVLALGSPVKVIRSLTPEEIESIKESAIKYVDLSKKHI